MPGSEKSREEWLERVYKPTIEKRAERSEHFETSSEIEFPPVFEPVSESSLPGEFPYTRGVHATMYRSKFWTMRQYAGFGDAEQSNARYRYLLDQGQTGLSVAFDLPTQMGFDSDSKRAEGEVGKVGVAIDSLADMEILLKGIPLDQVSTSMTINSTASTLLALYIAVALKQGVSPDALRGTIQNDILKEYMARGTYIYPPRPSMRIITDIFEYCAKEVPKWNTISISGYHIREAGCTAVQEIAFTLADGLAYIEAALKAGLEIDSFAPRLAFFFNVHNNFLEEIAKFRAARRLWARLVHERFGPKDPKSMMLRFHAQTAGSTLTAQQPENNIARVALQAMAAVMGGTQSLHTNSMDEALGLPTENAARVALRTQQVIAHETGVGDTVDPMGGSHAVESLTDRLEADAMKLIEDIDGRGGMVAAIEAGVPQRHIEEAAYQTQLRQEGGGEVVVGVNRFQADVAKPPIMKIEPELEARQKARTQKVRTERSASEAEAALASLKEAAASEQNLMPRILRCTQAYCTVGEIADVLRIQFGEHQEII